ncbi:MAG: hypothetical protein M3Q34_01350 [bacterium]|nr:hypothetical protein [bacterium]
MSKRNLKLLAVLMVIMLMVVLSYFYLGDKPKTITPADGGGGDNFFADLLNFGNSNKPSKDSSTPADVSGYVPENETEMQKMRLMKISSMPIAGYLVFNQERFVNVAPPIKVETQEGEELTPTAPKEITIRPTAPATELIPTLRYVAKENGNIFQTSIDVINERKFSNTLIPGVHEAFFATKGESVIMRYLKSDNSTIATWSGVLPKEVLGSDSVQPNRISGSFLTDNITDMSVSPLTNKIFYLFNSKDVAIGITSDATGSNKTQIYNGAYTEWLSQWPNDGLVVVTTKPSSSVPGYMYAINTSKKDFKKVLGNVNGLTTLTSPNADNVLYSNNRLTLSLYDTTERVNKELSIRTLAEKCVWGRGSDFVYCAVPKYIDTSRAYPDSWYQGEVSFSDDIWKINIPGGTAQMILDPLARVDGSSQNTTPIDGIKLSLSSDGKHLFFVNKADSYLWGLKLE